MSAEPDIDRSEAATPHKLEQARERGQVARSTDAVSAVVLAAAVVYLQARGWHDLQAQFRFDRRILAQAGSLDPRALWRLLEAAARETLQWLAPGAATVLLAAVVGNLAQTGPVVAWRALSPDWHRLDPAQGFKRLFSTRTAYEALRALVKLALLGGVLLLGLRALWPAMLRLGGAAPATQAQALLAGAAGLGVQVVLALGVVALADLAYTRREHARRMRMSRRELRDEHRHREGDPRVRARLRELRRDMLKRSAALRRTREADLVVTNPTHYAVALCYRHGEMAAPKLVAKGAGAMAAAMRGLAARHGVPVVRHPALARALHAQADIDQHVPAALYGEVARLIVWILAARRARRAPEAAQ